MKLPNLIYDIKTIVHRSKIPDDTNITNRLIVNWINNQRALWLTNHYNKGRDFKNNEIQSLHDVEFEILDANETNDIESGNSIIKSKKKIPRVLQISNKPIYTGYRSLDITEPNITMISRNRAPYAGNGILNKYRLFIYPYNDYFYLKYGIARPTSSIPLHFTIEGIFENPLEVDDFNETYNNILDGIDEYPISMSFVDYLKGEILKLDVQSLYSMPADENNDDEFRPR
jgi:hypothetical protein